MAAEVKASDHLQAMINLANQAQQAIGQENGEKNTRNLVKQLYHKTNEMKLMELNQKDPWLTDGTVMPALRPIYALADHEDYRAFIKLHRVLSRTFRALLEVMWYQALKKNIKVPVEKKDRDQFIDITNRTIEFLLHGRAEALPALLEYRNARQAARMLDTTDRMRYKYAKHIGEIIGTAQVGFPAGVAFNVNEVGEKIGNLYQDLKRDDSTGQRTWYPFTHKFRSDALLVQTPSDFKQVVQLYQAKCRDEGGNYSNCLAMILIEVFKRSAPNNECRQLAICGEPGEFEGLISLSRWRRVNSATDFFSHPIDNIKNMLNYISIFNYADRFSETRQLARRFLMKVITKERYQGAYHDEILETFNSRPKPAERSTDNAEPITHENVEEVINAKAANVRESAKYSGGKVRGTTDGIDPEVKKRELKEQLQEIEQKGEQLLNRIVNEMEIAEEREFQEFFDAFNDKKNGSDS